MNKFLLPILLLAVINLKAEQPIAQWLDDVSPNARPATSLHSDNWQASNVVPGLDVEKCILTAVPIQNSIGNYGHNSIAARDNQRYLSITLNALDGYALAVNGLILHMYETAAAGNNVALRWSVDDFTADIPIVRSGFSLDFAVRDLDMEAQWGKTVELRVYVWGSNKGAYFLRAPKNKPVVEVLGQVRQTSSVAGFVIEEGDVLLANSLPKASNPNVERDNSGNLLPAKSLDKFIEKGYQFGTTGQVDWFKGPLLKDGQGNDYPPYLSYSKARNVGVPYDNLSGRAVYPAFHHSIAINAFLTYYQYSGSEDSLKRAAQLADWNIANSTPEDAQYPNLPYSTYVQGRPGGFKDGYAIMIDKTGFMGLAYVRLYKITADESYLSAAQKIAESIAANQRDDGSLPFRVDPVSGEIKEDYTSNQITHIMLWEELDLINNNNAFAHNIDSSLQWLIDNPIKTLNWNGFYEDVGYEPDNRTNWDCVLTARYLLERSDENPEYMDYVNRLYEWMNEKFATTNHYYRPAEAFREQLTCYNIMGVHTLNWATLLADLGAHKDDPSYKERVEGMINFVTYLQDEQGKIGVGPWHVPFWYSCHFGLLDFLIQLFAEYPDLAPEGNHILKTPGEASKVIFTDTSIQFETSQGGQSVIKVAFEPVSVVVDERVLSADSWTYDSSIETVFVTHPGGLILIQGE